MSLPKVMDIYIKDYYVVVSKRSIIVFFLMVVAVPLAAFTIRWLRTADR
jgi:hypothetical protein